VRDGIGVGTTERRAIGTSGALLQQVQRRRGNGDIGGGGAGDYDIFSETAMRRAIDGGRAWS